MGKSELVGMEMTDKRIAVVGTGANGGAIAADLTQAGLDVTCIEQWPAHVEAMRADGILVETPGETRVTRVRVFHVCEVAELREQFDVVLIVVKAYDTRWTCELIKPLVGEKGLVVGIQNGMTMDDVASIFGSQRTMGAVIEIASNMFEPGIVNRQTPRGATWFGLGAYDESTLGREHEVADILRHTGKVDISKDIRSAKWMKLVANAAEFLPSALLNLPLAQAVEVPGIREVMVESGKEAIWAGLALGHQLVPILGKSRVEVNDPDQYAKELLDAILSGWTLPDTKVAPLQDWQKGRRGEVDDINGLVVRGQRKLGGRAPINEKLVELSHMVERGELKPDPSNAELLRSLLDADDTRSGPVSAEKTH
jgi:2-dehydropantoate 2-reductase